MWEAWADPHFDHAGHDAPVQPHSNCLKAAAMVRALMKEGLMEEAQPGDRPNARVLVKHKSDTKAALIMNLVAFNHTCAHKAPRFKLPSLKGLCGVLREVSGGAWATKVDLQKCYWSIVLPPSCSERSVWGSGHHGRGGAGAVWLASGARTGAAPCHLRHRRGASGNGSPPLRQTPSPAEIHRRLVLRS